MSFIAALGLPALAQGTPREARCDTPAAVDSIAYCADRDWRIADEALNEAYAWALRTAESWSEQAATGLRDAQRAWIPYRDRACEAESYIYEDPAVEPIVLMSCKAHLTRLRTENLRNTYDLN